MLLKDTRETIALYNVATGVRFTKRAVVGVGRRPAARHAARTGMLAALERLLTRSTRAAVILEYAEAIAPAGDPSFQADADRAAMVTLHRWSFLPEIEQGDNVVILIAENLTDLSPKLVSNPKVGVVEIPMPDTRRAGRRARSPTRSSRRPTPRATRS